MSNGSRSGNSRLKQPVVAHRQERRRTISLLYLVPAALLSALFNLSVLGILSLLNSPNQAPATTKTQLASAIPITAEQAPPQELENNNADPFVPSVNIDPSTQDVEPEFNFNAKDIPQPIIPGQDIPGLKLPDGMPGNNPFDIAPPPALGGFGQAGDVAQALSGINIPGSGGGMGPGGLGMPGVDPNNKVFGGRSTAGRAAALREGDATDASEAAVNLGLRFLAKLQQPDGRWRLDTASYDVSENGKKRTVIIPDLGHSNDVAGTALGLLPYLAAGKHHLDPTDNDFDKPIEKALAWLLRRQDKRTGNFGGSMYAHGLATIALCEAYGLSKDPVLKRPAQDAINYIVFAQHIAGGWRYRAKEAGDTSVAGWQIMALKSAQLAGLDVPDTTITRAINFLDAVCIPYNESYGYKNNSSSNATLSAVGLLCRQYLQFWGPNNSRLMKGIEKNILSHPPGSHRNMYYYYYATQVMHHFGGEAWKTWNQAMRDQLVARQVKTGDLAGSWDSRGDMHGRAGGRLMETSLCLLTLEVYYRHLPLFGR